MQRRGAGRGQGTWNRCLPEVELAVLKGAFHGTQGCSAQALWERSQRVLPLEASLLNTLTPTSAVAAA